MTRPDERETRLADYAAFFAHFNRHNLTPVLVGGHAVNIWAELYFAQEPELAAFIPFVSKDLDLYRADTPVLDFFRRQAFRVVEERDPFGKVWTPVGTIFFLKTPDGRDLSVDNLKSLNGLTEKEVRGNVIRVTYGDVVIHALSPIYGLKAKCHNLASISRLGRQDDRHVRIRVFCVRAFLRELLSGLTASADARPMLKALETLFHLAQEREVMSALRELHIPPSRLLPLAELRASPHPKIQTFVDKRLPQWLASIPPVTAASPGATSSPPAP